MKSLFLLFIFLSGAVSMAESAWFDKVRQMSDEADPQRVSRMETLRKDAAFIHEVCQALKSRSHLHEALQAVMVLRLQPCWHQVLEMANQDGNWEALQALQSLNRASPRTDWNKILKRWLQGAKWRAFSSPAKLVILFSAVREKMALPASVLKVSLSDETSDVRVAALQLLAVALQKSPDDEQLKSMLHQSMTKEPYQFRLEAYEMVPDLPQVIRAEFRPDLENCAKREAINRVKSICLRLQQSL